MEEKNGADYPPAITHPEYYYGFIGVALAFQVAFLIISRNPVQYRMMMIPAMLEKFSFSIAVFILFALGRVASMMVVAATIDFILGVLFVMAYLKTPKTE